MNIEITRDQIIAAIVPDVEFDIECLEEDIEIRGNAMASGDDEFDREVEDKIIADLEWNPWAWCCVRVTATWKGFEGEDYLGGCSYAGEKDFTEGGGYYEGMKDEALRCLADEILDTITRLGTLLEAAA